MMNIRWLNRLAGSLYLNFSRVTIYDEYQMVETASWLPVHTPSRVTIQDEYQMVETASCLLVLTSSRSDKS